MLYSIWNLYFLFQCLKKYLRNELASLAYASVSDSLTPQNVRGVKSNLSMDKKSSKAADATETYIKTEKDDRAGGDIGKSFAKARDGGDEEP